MEADAGTCTTTLLAHPVVYGTTSRKTAIRSVVRAEEIPGCGAFRLRERAGLVRHETQPARSDVYIACGRVG